MAIKGIRAPPTVALFAASEATMPSFRSCPKFFWSFGHVLWQCRQSQSQWKHQSLVECLPGANQGRANKVDTCCMKSDTHQHALAAHRYPLLDLAYIQSVLNDLADCKDPNQNR